MRAMITFSAVMTFVHLTMSEQQPPLIQPATTTTTHQSPLQFLTSIPSFPHQSPTTMIFASHLEVLLTPVKSVTLHVPGETTTDVGSTEPILPSPIQKLS